MSSSIMIMIARDAIDIGSEPGSISSLRCPSRNGCSGPRADPADNFHTKQTRALCFGWEGVKESAVKVRLVFSHPLW